MAKVPPAEFLASLKKGPLAPVYLVHGSDQRRADQAYKAIEARALEDGEPEFNADYFHGRDADPTAVLSAARTMPMMAERRLVAVRHLEEMKAPAREPIMAYLADPNPSTVLLLHAGALDLRKGDGKFETAAAKAGVSVNFSKPKPWEVPDAIIEMARERGKKMDKAAANALSELAGDDMLAVEMELEKVILYRPDRKAITREDVLEAVADIREAVVYEFTDALAAKNAEAALRSYRRMRDQEQEPLMILGMMARHFRIIWKIQEYKREGQSDGMVAKNAGLNEFIMKKNYLPRLKEFPPRETGRVMRILADLDIKLKSSRTDKDVLFERAVLKLCSRRLG